MKAVIYARYSSDNQREESIEGQLRECQEFALKNDMTILRSYIDRALSAKTDNRPEFQNMIKDSAKGLFDVIIVWKLDRFARNRYDSAHYKAMLRKNGVKVVSATEVISEGAEGIILESVLEGYAEYYSAELSEKVIRGRTENALKCKFNGGSLPIGYTVDDNQMYAINPMTAPVVLEAFTDYANGKTVKQIVDMMNNKGLRSSYGNKITINTVQRMLKNRKYIGEYNYRDICNPNGIPAIVPRELFDRVQEKVAKNKKAPARHKAIDDYILTTKLYCGKCGAYMIGESGTSHTKKVHHYYKCVTAKNRKGCDKKTVKKAWIENLVVDYTMQIVFNDEIINKITNTAFEMQSKENVSIPLLKKKLTEIEKGIDNMLNAIQQGVLTSSTKQRLEQLENEKEEISIQLAQEELKKPRLTKEQITFFLKRFRELDVTKLEHRKQLINTFINAIYLYDDKLVLIFNYKDGSNTVSLKEVEGSDLTTRTAPKKTCRLASLFLLKFL